MHILILSTIALLFAAGGHGTPAGTQSGPAGTPEADEALDGLDPVLLVGGKEVAGKTALSVTRGGFVYLFSTEETRAAFEADPAKYEIQFGGICARMGKTAGGNPSDFLVHEGRIYIFGSDDCHKKFKADPARYLPGPPAPLPFSAVAVAAISTPAAFDALTSYVESMTQVQTRPQGEVTVATKTMWSFPGRVRQERSMTMQGKTMTSATVMSPEGLWFLGGQGQVYPMRAAGRASLQQEFGRHPVALLHAYRLPVFTPVAAGKATIDGIAVENLRVVLGPIDVTLALDASGRIRAETYRDRNNDGEFGVFVVTYADFRSVNGWMLPHAITATFNGQPYPALTSTLDTIAVNTRLEPSLFAPQAAK
jgi:YHS domain-containing protein